MRADGRLDTILVVDAGTVAMRAIAVRADGRTEMLFYAPWDIQAPDQIAPFGREIAAWKTRTHFSDMVGDAAEERERLAGIAFTGQREGLVFADERGNPLLISPNLDGRAAAEGAAIDAVRRDEVYATTGHLPSLMQAPAKLAWLREHCPEAADRVRYIVPLPDWLASLLSGEMFVSRSLAAENGMLDVRTLEPARELWSKAGSSFHLVPPIVRDGAAVLAVRDGTLAGLPVVLCGADTQCALVGMGAVRPGDAAVPAGTTAPVQVVTGAPLFDAHLRTWTGVHVVDDRWVVESNAGETGRAWSWLSSLLLYDYEASEHVASASPVGANDFMTVLGPRTMNAAAMNAGVGGITFPTPLAGSPMSRSDLVRSMLESIAYAIRSNLEHAESVAGSRAETFALGGGMSRSATFAQSVADVLDRPVRAAASPHTTALGAAALAAASLGLHDSVETAIEAMTRDARVVEPDRRAAVEYEDYYRRWCDMADAFARMG